MRNSVFGELVFNTGWKTKAEIVLFSKNYSIVVKAKAYFEKDGITKEQEAAFANFQAHKTEQLNIAEKLLMKFSVNEAAERFIPRTLLFQRDGSYALLLDDNEDEDGGIAVSLEPTAAVLSQDDYL